VREPPARKGIKEERNPNARTAGNQLIFTGAINGRKWRFALAYTNHRLMVYGPGDSRSDGPGASTGGDPASLDGFTEGSLAGAVGPVRKDVARLTERLRNGTVLHLHQDAGNGFCNSPADPLAPGHLVGWRSCGGGPPELAIAEADPAVRHLRLSFSDGSVRRVPAVSIVGRRYFAFGIPTKVRFTGWTAYGAAGQRLGSGPGWGFC
jgi:hypothetical protein